jgi:hypothetical protein
VLQVEALLHELQALAQTFDPPLAQLAAVDWRALARQGYLPGIPGLAIERTIEDARAVLASGQRVLTEVLQQIHDPQVLAKQEELDLPSRLRAAIRLYADTPSDMRNRCQRLTIWLTVIAQAQRQAGVEPLTSRILWPASS